MGKRKKNNKLKEFLIAIVIIAILIFAEKAGIFKYIDETIVNTGIAEIVDASKESNIITVAEVKKDDNIISSVSENINIDNNKLNILFFDVGQADSQLIICNGKTMLIDAGNSKDGEKLVNGIKALGISKLDYVIGTHVHEDHIGGMSYIIDSFDIGAFYLPYNTNTTSSYYKRLLTSISNKGLEITEAVIGEKIEFSSAICEIMSVDNNEPENANLASIILQISYGTQKYLFMGDAETENEKSRNWEDIDVLKVGHHGSNTSSSEKFLKQVLPEIAIISVGEGNSYGLPKDKIIDRFEKMGTTIYRTDEDGTIQIVSDGNTNEIIKIELSFDGNE